MTTTTSLPVTAIILTHRAGPTLERALTSVQWAAEVLVVDHQSGADWSSLGNRYRLHVVTPENIQTTISDFAAVRDWATSLAQQEWVFFLDSDEELEAVDVSELAALISQQELAGVYFKRADVFHGQRLHWGETGDLSLLRMARQNQLKFERPVHEVGRVQGQTTQAQTTITHHAHDSISSFLTRVNQYAYREAQHRRQQGERFSLVQLLMWPLGKFVVNYVFKSGWRDGWAGLVYAVLMSLHSLFVRVHLYELTYD